MTELHLLNAPEGVPLPSATWRGRLRHGLAALRAWIAATDGWDERKRFWRLRGAVIGALFGAERVLDHAEGPAVHACTENAAARVRLVRIGPNEYLVLRDRLAGASGERRFWHNDSVVGPLREWEAGQELAHAFAWARMMESAGWDPTKQPLVIDDPKGDGWYWFHKPHQQHAAHARTQAGRFLCERGFAGLFGTGRPEHDERDSPIR